MGRLDDEHTERFYFTLSGDLAIYVRELKQRGYFVNNAEIGRASIPLLVDHYNKLGMVIGQDEKKKK